MSSKIKTVHCVIVQIGLVVVTNVLSKNVEIPRESNHPVLIGEESGLVATLGWAIFASLVYWGVLLLSFAMVIGISNSFSVIMVVVWSAGLFVFGAVPFYGALYFVIRGL